MGIFECVYGGGKVSSARASSSPLPLRRSNGQGSEDSRVSGLRKLR